MLGKEISIPFNKWSKNRLLYTKFSTCRNRKYGDVGDFFYVNNIKYKLDLVIQLPIWFIANELWFSEGAICKKEFNDIINKIYKNKVFNKNTLLWYHHFKLVK